MPENGWQEYAASLPPSNFELYENEYREYISTESLSKPYSPVISAFDLFKRPKLPITSYVPGFVYAGSLNLIAGEPKAGKSTLVWHLTNAISLGEKFLGEEVRKTNVLYITEQNEVSFRQETATIPNFSTNPNLFILLPEVAPIGSWTQHIEFWGEKLELTKSSILVIDTFGSFANLPPGGENDSACIADRFMTLKKLYKNHHNLAIILVHHIRKPGVDPRYPAKDFMDLRDARGSSAIAGGTDHVIMLSKQTAQSGNIRNIHTEGRFIPENKFQIVLTDNGYKEYGGFRNSFTYIKG